jgi:membrane protease YdiL (CAAX protease family)
MIPVLAYASTFPQIAAFHPFSRLAARHAKALLLYEGSLLLFIAGWEFFFRGFLLFGLKNELGDAAIYLQVIPYSVMYLNRPAAEALASIPAAIVLGHLASRTGSVLYGIVLHWVCALTLDMFIIYDVF